MGIDETLKYCLDPSSDVSNTIWTAHLNDAEKYVCVPTSGSNNGTLQSMVAKANGIDKPLKKQVIGADTFFEISDENAEKQTVKLPEKPENLNGTQLYYWLQQHRSTTKANVQHAPDTLSEFEYLKSRAAFAHCLATENKDETQPFLLVCGDLSGIQDFIYDIHSSKAAMSLKGRSFYLGLVLDAIMRSILDKTEIPICNIIYSNGGKFYMLLPNTSAVCNALETIKTQVTKGLFEEFGGKLYCCLAWVGFGINDGGGITTEQAMPSTQKGITHLNALWQCVTEKASQEKTQKFRVVLQEKYKDFFKGELHGDPQGKGMVACAVTGLPVKEIDCNLILDDNEERADKKKMYVLPAVKLQIELGQDLKNCRYIAIKAVTEDFDDKNWLNPLTLGYAYQLTETIITENKIENYSINPKSTYKWWAANCSGIWWYGGNKQATDEHTKKWKNFNQLSDTDEVKEGDITKKKKFKKLAVLRMDIDNLGSIFTKSNALETQYRSFALCSALSFQLDQFFSGYLNTLVEKDFKHHVNIIYSGGDDLFIIGRWNEIIEVAAKIQADFKALIGGKCLNLSISAGISLIQPKFPIQKAADLAKEALEDYAKEYDSDGYTKDAIHLLGSTVSWTNTNTNTNDKAALNEWAFVIALSKQMEIWLDNQTISKGFIYKLFSYQSLALQQKNNWQWQCAYDMKRYMNRYDKQADKQAIFKEFSTAIITGCFDLGGIKFKAINRRTLELICLAANIADYSTR